MKNVLTILKKELSRVFKDKFLILALILPGIMIFVIYNFMGDAFAQIETGEGQQSTVVSANLPSEIHQILSSKQLEFDATYTNIDQTTAEIEQNIQKLKDNHITILLVFDQSFSVDIANGQKPNISIYFNPTDVVSTYAYEKVVAALEVYRQVVLIDRQIDASVFVQEAVATYNEKSAVAGTLAMMLPMLMITMLFSSCMSLAPDAIAGEKERGTIATILITPIKRSQLAFGKVLSLSVLATVSAASTFLGLILSLPKLLGGMSLDGIYGATEFALLFLVVFSTVLLIIGIMSILSTLAKTVKEATMFITPIMLVSIVVSILSMTGSGSSLGIVAYLIPIFNSAQAMISILTFEVDIIHLIITFVSNFVCMVICVLIITKLFNSEKVMFRK